MMKAIIAAAAILALTSASEARGRHHHASRGHHHRVAYDGGSVVAHPAGCPWTAFCGCGASVRIFGHPVRSLYLASNWFRFPRAAAAPGMAAVRSHHVFIIEAVHGDGTVTAYDANSGGHMTREHRVSLAGYTVVNPGGSLAAEHRRRHYARRAHYASAK